MYDKSGTSCGDRKKSGQHHEHKCLSGSEGSPQKISSVLLKSVTVIGNKGGLRSACVYEESKVYGDGIKGSVTLTHDKGIS